MDRIIAIMIMGILALVALTREQDTADAKVRGASLVAPRQDTELQAMDQLQQAGIRWVAMIPFAFSRGNEASVVYDRERQWWGERSDGLKQSVIYAKALGYKVLVKPHVWVRGDGWPGEFQLENDSLWREWEKQYASYILAFARVSAEAEADMFCIGTEFRYAARERPEFWKLLIQEVRKVYPGPLTYAANWDNYEHVGFWKDLDYIGIDAYFPLSDKPDPSLEELISGWERQGSALETFSRKHDRKILFTEYGYRSTAYAADGHWKHNLDDLVVNHGAQRKGYQALYETIWNEPWMAGGFLWKWHLTIPTRPGFMDKAYSPQGKPVMEIIRKHYGAP